MNITTLTRICDDGVGVFINHKILVSLLLTPKMLMMLDPPTFMGSPRCEFPLIPHTIWSRSPIQYYSTIFEFLNIFFGSSYQQER